MPVVTLTLMEGYDESVREDLGRRLTDAISAVINPPLDGITVVIHEVAPANYMRGRSHRTPGRPSLAPVEVVRQYLYAMESRDLDGAESYLADGFTMTFPGGAVFHRAQELVDWAMDRYRWVKKIYQRFDEAPAEDGVVVTCFGTLHGEWPDGEAFEGIRFIDRFTVRAGKILDQMVWNDMGEVRQARKIG